MTVEIQEERPDNPNNDHSKIKPEHIEYKKEKMDIFLTVKLFGEIFSRFLARED